MSMRYTIRQLAEQAGINRRTIRYYISEGLVPSACGEGRGSYYTDEHLERLRVINRGKEAGLSLEEIKHRTRAAVPPHTWTTYDVTNDVRVSFGSTVLHDRRSRVLDAVNNVLENEDG